MKALLYLFMFFNLNFGYLLSQEINQDFLDSLPENIKADLLSNIDSEAGKKPLSDKGYDAFDSKANLNNQSDIKDFDDIQRFGDIFFVNTPSTFMPINDPAANSGYILDTDDELLIQLIGDRSDQYSFKIDRSGSIAINEIGRVTLAGLSLDSANKLVNEILKKNFIETQAVISLEKVRDIEILITGHVRYPGIYTLNGYSNILHALIMAGGISKNGSMIWNYTDKATLKMKNFSEDELKKYLSKISDQALYAYNVYQIEGEGKNLFESIIGDENTIMGLPIKKIKEYLAIYDN